MDNAAANPVDVPAAAGIPNRGRPACRRVASERPRLRPSMRVLMVSQFYPPVAGGQEQYVRNLAHALSGRGHGVEVVTIAASAPAGTTLDETVPVHRIRTSAQRLPQLYSDPDRPH